MAGSLWGPVWGRRGASTVAVEVEGDVEVVQAWSRAPTTVVREAGRLEMRCDQSFPVCAVAAAVDPTPPWVRPLVGTVTWLGVEGDATLRIDDLESPGNTPIAPGTYLWWNRPRSLVVGGYEETIDRLRALGYIE